MFLQLQVWAFWLLQESGGVGWDPKSLWNQMGTLAKFVVVVLFIMSAWSIGVMIDRLMAFSAARKQSRHRSARKFRVKRSKRRSGPWSARKPLCTQN